MAGLCYKDGDPLSYTGNVSATVFNIPCKRWDLTEFTDASLFPDTSVSAASNFCRDPDKDGTGPWCYDIDGAEDYCDVLKCSDAGLC